MEESTLTKNLEFFNTALKGTGCKLIAVSKTKPIEMLLAAYQAGIRIFGENKVQEMADKHNGL